MRLPANKPALDPAKDRKTQRHTDCEVEHRISVRCMEKFDLRNNFHIILNKIFAHHHFRVSSFVASLSVLIHTNYKINKFQLWDNIINRGWKRQRCQWALAERASERTNKANQNKSDSLFFLSFFVWKFATKFRDRHAYIGAMGKHRQRLLSEMDSDRDRGGVRVS